jgi:GAF domain-containing protein
MEGVGEFNRQLAAAVRAMQEEPDTKSTLDRAVITATEIIDGCDLAGISIVHVTGIDTVSASDESLKRIDDLQFSIGQGPCLDALQDHETVHSPDLSNDERWPEWGPHIAQEIGVGSNVSYRLFTNRHSLGALNLYSRKTHAFRTDDIYHGLARISTQLVECKPGWVPGWAWCWSPCAVRASVGPMRVELLRSCCRITFL